MNTAIIKKLAALCSFTIMISQAYCQSYDAEKDGNYLQWRRGQIDSLNYLPPCKDDSACVDRLIRLANWYVAFSMDTSLLIARRAWAIAEKRHIPKTMAGMYVLFGQIYYTQRDYIHAEDYWLKGLTLAIDNKLYDEELHSFRIILNNLYFHTGDYYKAARISLEGLSVATSRDDKKSMAHFNNVLGYIYLKQDNLILSSEYYKTYYRQALELNDSGLIAHALINLADLAYAQKKYDESLEKLNESFAIYSTLGMHNSTGNDMQERQAYIFNRKALLFTATAQLPRALEQSREAIAITRKVSCNRYDIAEYYINAGAVLNSLGRPREAIPYLKSGLYIAAEIVHRENEKNAYGYLAESYKLLHRYDSAFYCQQRFYALRDSVFSSQAAMKINDITRSREIQLLNQDKKLRESELVQQQLVRNIIIALAIFTIAILVLLYNRYRIQQKMVYQQQLNRHRDESLAKIISVQDKERKRIAQNIHDGPGAVLSAAKLKLTEAIAAGEDQQKYSEALKLLDDAYAEIRNISHTIMPATLSKMGLVAALNNLFDTLSFTGLTIHFAAHGIEERLPEETEISLYYIILELVNNAVKHANAKNCTVQLIKHAEYLNLTVEDDGIGFKPGKNNSTPGGMGINNLVSRVESLKGSFEIDSETGSGTTVLIDIPYKEK